MRQRKSCLGLCPPSSLGSETITAAADRPVRPGAGGARARLRNRERWIHRCVKLTEKPPVALERRRRQLSNSLSHHGQRNVPKLLSVESARSIRVNS
jgi:hypothetical protein